MYDSWYGPVLRSLKGLRLNRTLYRLLIRIQSMSIAPLEAIKMNRSLVLDGKFDPELLQTIVDGRSRPWNGTNSVRGVPFAIAVS